MNKYLHYLVGFALFAFCSVVLLISLFASNRLKTGQTDRLLTSRLYFSESILPDNILYPLLMARDKVWLLMTPRREQVFVKIEYAEDRYQSADQLLKTGEEGLAVSTMTKSQKYMLEAVFIMRANPELYSEAERAEVRAALDHSLFRMEEFQARLTEQSPALDSLSADSLTVLTQTDIF